MTNNTFAILLNYNDGENLVRSVKSLDKLPSVKKIIIVDNGSTDDSIENVKKLKSQKLIITYNYKNLGFARGCNVGFKMAIALGADSVINLNPDMSYDYDFVKILAETDGDVIGPVLKFKRAGKWIYDFGGMINPWFGRAYHLETDSQEVLLRGKKTSFPDAQYVCGGSLFVKKHVFEKIGYLDERYFIYYEDADFSFTARKAGFKVVITPKAVLEHKLEIHKVSKNLNKLRWNLESNIKFINKWIDFPKRIFAYGYWLLLATKTILQTLL